MNVRLLDVVRDIYINLNTKDISEAVVLVPFGTKVRLISDDTQITYKEYPLDVPSLGGDAGCSCLYFNNPSTTTEDLNKILLDMGLIAGEEGETEISIVTSQSEGSIDLKININSASGVSSDFVSIRDRYDDDRFFNSTTPYKQGSFSPHIFRNTFWNYFLTKTGLIKDQKEVLAKYFSNKIKVVAPSYQTYSYELDSIKYRADNRRFIGYTKGNINDNCEGVLYINSDISKWPYVKVYDAVIPLYQKPNLIRYAYCDGSKIHMVLIVLGENCDCIVNNIFDYNGKNIGLFRYETSNQAIIRYLNNTIIYFDLFDNYIVLGVDKSSNYSARNPLFLKLPYR